jgi:hypothetical protein
MLENAGTPLSELRQVKNNADLEQTKTGQSLTHDEYLNLHLSTASAYGNQFASKKPKRNVFMHIIGDSDDDFHIDDISYNMDAPVSTLLAKSTEGRNKSFGSNIKNGVHMQRYKWFNLDTKSKEIWDQLDDKAKSIILGYDTRGYNSSLTPSNGIQ